MQQNELDYEYLNMMTLPDKKKRKSTKGSGAQTPQKKTAAGSLLDSNVNRNFTEEPGAGTYDSSMSFNQDMQESNPKIRRR